VSCSWINKTNWFAIIFFNSKNNFSLSLIKFYLAQTSSVLTISRLDVGCCIFVVFISLVVDGVGFNWPTANFNEALISDACRVSDIEAITWVII